MSDVLKEKMTEYYGDGTRIHPVYSALEIGKAYAASENANAKDIPRLIAKLTVLFSTGELPKWTTKD